MGSLADGMVLGLAYAIPIGALNVFVIQSAISHRSSHAYQTAFAVSLMDVTLGLACFFGVGTVFSYLPILKPLLLVAGAIFLLKTGSKLLFSKEDPTFDQNTDPRVASSIWRSALILTWLNPHALIDGTILLGGVRASLSAVAVTPFLIGVLIALPVWYFSIVAAVRLLREKFSARAFVWIQRICGSVLIYFGVKFALTLLRWFRRKER